MFTEGRKKGWEDRKWKREVGQLDKGRVRILGRENSKNKFVEAQKSMCLLRTSGFLGQAETRRGKGML